MVLISAVDENLFYKTYEILSCTCTNSTTFTEPHAKQVCIVIAEPS